MKVKGMVDGGVRGDFGGGEGWRRWLLRVVVKLAMKVMMVVA